MKIVNLFLGVMVLCGGHAAMAGEVGIGHGVNGPSAAPDLTETESSSENYWQELLEWFETDDDGE